MVLVDLEMWIIRLLYVFWFWGSKLFELNLYEVNFKVRMLMFRIILEGYFGV